MQTCINDCQIIRTHFTDHDAVKITWQIDDYKRGPGVWKFNNLHLRNSKFLNMMRATLRRSSSDTVNLNIHERWDTIKYEARCSAIDFGKKTAVSNKIHLENLTKSVTILKEKLVTQPSKDIIQQAIERIENEIEAHAQARISSSIMRSRINFALDGELGTKYYLSLEKRNYFCKNIRAINSPTGIVKQQDKILNEQRKFYHDLYTSNKNVVFNLTPQIRRDFSK